MGGGRGAEKDPVFSPIWRSGPIDTSLGESVAGQAGKITFNLVS